MRASIPVKATVAESVNAKKEVLVLLRNMAVSGSFLTGGAGSIHQTGASCRKHVQLPRNLTTGWTSSPTPALPLMSDPPRVDSNGA